MRRILVSCFLLAFGSSSFAGTAKQVSPQVSRETANSSALSRSELEESFAFEKYVPFQSFRYEYGFDDQTKGGEGHTLRIDMKSFEEMMSFSRSRQISRALLEVSRQKSINMQAYADSLSLVKAALRHRLIKLFDERGKQLSHATAKSSRLLGLTDSSPKDVVSALDRLYKTEREGESLKPWLEASNGRQRDLDALAKRLVTNVPVLLQKIEELDLQQEPMELKVERLEFELKELDRKVGWADDRKLLSHIELRRNFDDNENIFRINFNVPWLRFDRENQARERALHQVQKEELARNEQLVKSELEQMNMTLQSLAAQIASTKARLEQTLKLTKRIGRGNDIELERVLSDLVFDLERELLNLNLDFYEEYLKVLHERGLFASRPKADFLEPGWAEAASSP